MRPADAALGIFRSPDPDLCVENPAYNCCYTFIKYQHVLFNIHEFTTSNAAGIIISPQILPKT